MAPSKWIGAAWELTKPQGDFWAEKYRAALDQAILVPAIARYRPLFYVAKGDGRRRLIFPAGEDLRFVQSVLAEWITHSFPLGDDFCYLGKRGVLKAVQKHQGSNYALVFDLKNAFESVTSKMIAKSLRLYRRDVDEEVIYLIVDLLTVRGRARQGCVSTPHIYNLVIKPLDDGLALLRGQFNLAATTRYADNICLSATEPIDFDELEAQVRRFVRGNGFKISWSHRFDNEPIIYLGTQIWQGQLGLAEEKYGEFCFRVMEAIDSPIFPTYWNQMLGIFNWARHICGEDIPGDLLSLLDQYFRKTGQIPRPLAEILARKRTRRMF